MELSFAFHNQGRYLRAPASLRRGCGQGIRFSRSVRRTSGDASDDAILGRPLRTGDGSVWTSLVDCHPREGPDPGGDESRSRAGDGQNGARIIVVNAHLTVSHLAATLISIPLSSRWRGQRLARSQGATG